MNDKFKQKLRIEKSINRSGKIRGLRTISILKESNYCILPYELDGDAPKQFIKAYFYERNQLVSFILKERFRILRSVTTQACLK